MGSSVFSVSLNGNTSSSHSNCICFLRGLYLFVCLEGLTLPCSVWASLVGRMSWDMWDLSSLIRDRTISPAVEARKKVGNWAEILGSRSAPFLETVYNSSKRTCWQEKPVRGCRCCPPGCNGALLFFPGRSCHSWSKKLVNWASCFD